MIQKHNTSTSNSFFFCNTTTATTTTYMYVCMYVHKYKFVSMRIHVVGYFIRGRGKDWEGKAEGMTPV